MKKKYSYSAYDSKSNERHGIRKRKKNVFCFSLFVSALSALAVICCYYVPFTVSEYEQSSNSLNALWYILFDYVCCVRYKHIDWKKKIMKNKLFNWNVLWWEDSFTFNWKKMFLFVVCVSTTTLFCVFSIIYSYGFPLYQSRRNEKVAFEWPFVQT